MGGAPSFKPFNLTLPPFFAIIIILTITTFILIAGADINDSVKDLPPLEDDNGATTTTLPPDMQSPDHRRKPDEPAFMPSTAVIMGVLITTFSLAFLLLLYIKHCNGGHMIFTASDPNSQGAPPTHERKNSGIERAVVESLPIFRFRSLRGQKIGLDCAVCLTRFEDPEVLRLIPCKHAFHVECVDTWLDAHSTCPLCRYKVNPEDIVLVDAKEEEAFDNERARNNNISVTSTPEIFDSRRFSGGNSSVGERDGEFLQVILQTSNEQGQEQGQNTETSSFRRSLDSSAPRKDGTLLLTQDVGDRTSAEHRLEHRIIVSPGGPHHQHQQQQQQQRWSDVQASDLLYLTSEMIISDASSARGGRRTVVRERNRSVDGETESGGRGVMNWRSVSAMTGMSRFMSREGQRGGGEEQEGVVSRWLGWISMLQPRGDVR